MCNYKIVCNKPLEFFTLYGLSIKKDKPYNMMEGEVDPKDLGEFLMHKADDIGQGLFYVKCNNEKVCLGGSNDFTISYEGII